MKKFIISLALIFSSLGFSKQQIYDCFTFFNEIEILRIRIEELYDVVDHFVIVEATLTFSGQSKPLFFLENKHLFSQFEDKIIYVLVDDFPPTTNDAKMDAWNREYHQRNQILRGLTHCSDSDVIMISDVDEIPRHDNVANLPRLRNKIYNLDMQYFRYQLNRIDPRIDPASSHGGRVASYGLVKKYGPQNIRGHQQVKRIPNAAWHFTSIGNLESIIFKHGAFSHFCEISPAFFTQSTEHWNKEILRRYPAIPIDETFPRYVRENKDRYIKLDWIATVDSDWASEVNNLRKNPQWAFGRHEHPLEWEMEPRE